MKKGDIILIGLLVLFGAGYGFYTLFAPSSSASFVKVFQDSELLYRLPLHVDTKIRVQAPGGGYNLIVIEGGRAFIQEADCPDLICVRSRPITEPGQSTICLPHRLVLTGEGQPAFDAVAE